MALSIKQVRRRALKKTQAQANLELAAPTVSATSGTAAIDHNEDQSSDLEETSDESISNCDSYDSCDD